MPELAALPESIGELGSWMLEPRRAAGRDRRARRADELDLAGCSSLAALPDAIGELGALTTLVCACSSLAALPDAIGTSSAR